MPLLADPPEPLSTADDRIIPLHQLARVNHTRNTGEPQREGI